MKKLFTCLFTLLALAMSAQVVPGNVVNHLKAVSRADMPVKQNRITPGRSTTNISIDYDSFDRKWAALNPPDDVVSYSWLINKNNPNDSVYTLRYAVQTYDTLIDVNNNFAGVAKQGATVTIDSFDLILNHSNVSGLNDTFIVSVFDKNAATVTGSGVTSTLNTTSLWSDTIIANFDFFPTDTLFYYVTFAPNVTLPAGHVAGIRVDFKGPVADQLGVIASFREHCGATNFSTIIADTNKVAPRNSSYYLNLQTNSGFYNYATNLAVNSTSACKYFYIQNFWFFPYVTVNTPSGGGCVIDPSVTSGISPVSDNVPCINRGVSFSQTYTFVVPSTVATLTVNSMTIDSIRNLPAGLTYSFDRNPPTYPGGTKGCILVTGTTNDACGQYKTLIYVTVNVVGIGNVSGELSALASQYSIPGFEAPYLRVKDVAGTCPAVSRPTPPVPNFIANPSCGIATTITLTTTSTNVSCFGGNDGSATVTASGGTTYTYSWNPGGGTTATINNLTAGTYTVTVTSNGSSATASVTITQPSAAVSATTSTTTTTCGASTGSATVTPAGGTPGYTYNWNTTPAQTTATASSLGSGSYNVTVTDSKGCTATASAVVTAPGGPTASVASTTNVACFGASTGAVDITVTGGTGTITYSWNTTPVTSTQDLTGVAAGTYSVTITDANNCSFGLSATVTQPAAAINATATTVNVACFGASTGSINVAVTGGTGAYTYNWGGGVTTQNRTALAAGAYNVTITDANNCTFHLSASVSQPTAALTATASSTVNSHQATATAAGGTTPYTYLWSPGSQTTSTATGLAAGNYSVVVTDANSCTASASVTVVITGINEIGNEISGVSVFPNPANDKLNVVIDLVGNHNIQINVTDVNGRVVYAVKETANGKLSREINVNALPAGVYVMEATAEKETIRKQFIIAR